ncbi:MAG: DNA replication/repair protein RecF [Oscillospiraceae bacterium]|nr:DNA replication/repair protein RecF [Oscillospiraceae bacterium]
MRIENLYLRNFRNYEEENLELSAGVNLFLGKNAQGKTNFLEAVNYLSTGRSFRARKEEEMLHFGAEFAEIKGTVFTHERDMELRAILFAGRKPRQLYLNGVKQKTFSQNMAGEFLTVLFCPEDLLVLKGGSSPRRRLLDNALSQLRKGYEDALTEYSRLLEHKNRILKDWHEDSSLLELLPDFNLRLCRFGAELIHSRAGYLSALAEKAREHHLHCAGGGEELTFSYLTVPEVEDPHGAKEDIFRALIKQVERLHRAELESGSCLAGPHKDDFEVFLSGKSLKSYGSQGQTRTAAISLKLAERDLILQDTGHCPVLLLDDVLSELDEKRQDFILNRLEGGQVLITCCENDRRTEAGKVFSVTDGRIAVI